MSQATSLVWERRYGYSRSSVFTACVGDYRWSESRALEVTMQTVLSLVSAIKGARAATSGQQRDPRDLRPEESRYALDNIDPHEPSEGPRATCIARMRPA